VLGLIVLGAVAGVAGAAALARRVLPSRLARGIEARPSEPGDPAAPTLTVEGLALFGGIAVGSRGA